MEYHLNRKTNPEDFVKKYGGKKFVIKGNKMEIEVKLDFSKSIIDKDKGFYILKTLEKSNIGVVEYVFFIKFIDRITHTPSFRDVYIENISKSEKYSGSQIVKFVLDFLKSITSVRKVYLYDAAEIRCKNSDDKVDLSMYKLIVNNRTFYQKFGFRLITKIGDDKNNEMKKCAKKLGDYKIKDIYRNFGEILKFCERYREKIETKIIIAWEKVIEVKELDNYKDVIEAFVYLMHIMKSYKRKTFREFLEKLNEKECYNLHKFMSYLLNDYKLFPIAYIYKNKKVESNFLLDYYKLYIYRNNWQWEGLYVLQLK